MRAAPARSLWTGLRAYARTLVMTAAVLTLVAGLVAVRQHLPEVAERDASRLSADGSVASHDPEAAAAATADAGGPAATGLTAGGNRASSASTAGARAGQVIPGRGTVPHGVTDNEILVAYYWKGDRTMTSPFLHGSGQEGNVDEAEAFRALLDYINKYRNGGATLMGLPFNLHGRRLRGLVKEAGQYPDTYAATAEDLAKNIKPFAAISSHGSLSAYICPRLADARIFNISTYDLAGNLYSGTRGHCMPGGMSWERQVEFTQAYLVKHASTLYQDPTEGPKPRKYGLLYAEYPGLVDSAPRVYEQFRRAGIPMVWRESLATDLATAQQMSGNAIARFKAAGVNTIVMPDAGAPLSFTHAAQANRYFPDYYVWPCSGQDTSGMVRLFNAPQWERAEGLTCYDREFNPDLVNDDTARRTEWYRQYQEVRGDVEPPAPTPIVYQSLHLLLAGITNAGRDLTYETFRTGLDLFAPYRYDSVKGVEADPKNMLISINSPDRSPSGDVARLEWSTAARRSNDSVQGAYVYPDDFRYGPGGRSL